MPPPLSAAAAAEIEAAAAALRLTLNVEFWVSVLNLHLNNVSMYLTQVIRRALF